MKKYILIFILFSLPSISHGNNFTQITSNGIRLEFISYNVGSEDFDIKVWISETAEPLSSISKDYWAISGINGVFFCPADYSRCWGENYTINERFLDGNDLSFYQETGERAVFWWDSNSLPFLYQTAQINPEKRDEIFEWLGNFPILYSNWVNMLEHYHDVWLYDLKMSAKLSRHFICSNKEKTEIFFGKASATSLDDLAPALFNIWCWDGLNLDAGASSHFNYNGRELVVWKRKVLDWFFIVPKNIDIEALNNKIETAMTQVSNIYKRYPTSTALARITIVREYIKAKRADMYNSYSKDIYDKNWDLVWYNLNVTDTESLRLVYIYNVLNIELKKLYNDISK